MRNTLLSTRTKAFWLKNLERLIFKRMMADSKNEKVDYIVCYRLDRISRNLSDFSSLITDLNDRNIAFVSVKEPFDTSTPMSRPMAWRHVAHRMLITISRKLLEKLTAVRRICR